MNAPLRIALESTLLLAPLGIGFLAAILGYADAGWPSALVGGVVSLILSSAIAFALRDILALCFPSASDDQPDQVKTSRVGYGARVAWHATWLALCIVGLHEAYYLLQISALAVNHTTAAIMTQETYDGSSRDLLKHKLSSRRWQHAGCSARPVRWLIEDEIEAVNNTNLVFIQVINGELEPHVAAKDAGLLERIGNVAAAEIWRSESGFAKGATDRIINRYGAAVCKTTDQKIEGNLRRGWILRWIPIEWLKAKPSDDMT